VRFQLGIVCLLAGCVVQPTSPDPTSSPSGATNRVAAGGMGLVSLVPRIGIEHLPPDEATASADAVPRVDAQPKELPRPPVHRRQERIPERREPAARHTWSMNAEDLAAIDDPIARETLRFVHDLVEADQRRVRDEVALPFLALEAPDYDRGPLLYSEEALHAAQGEWAQQHGPSLLRRPLKQLLRRLPVVREVELEFDEFRSENVPLSEPYRNVHGDRSSLGRLSMRVRGDMSDPVEVAWVTSGIRFGTSQDRARMSIAWDLTSTVRFQVRATSEYETHEEDFRVDLAYRPSDWTSVHIAVGDDMDFLSTSSIYSLFETPMDGSAGLVLYAVHVF
jgi:hypothetical protein